jgi:pyrroline-5-carboxylate reductase
MNARIGQKIAFIGAGNMARAILGGIVKGGLAVPEQCMAADVSEEQLARLCKSVGSVATTTDNRRVVEFADVVIIATKPYHVGAVCEAVASAARAGQLFVSICAGIRTGFIEAKLGGDARVVRVMPNTPALIGCGASAIAPGSRSTPGDLALVKSLFAAVGTAVEVEEGQLDLVTGLTGSGPAYVFRFAEALIQAGCELGLSEAKSRALVLQTVHGAARMAFESGTPLMELRQAVTTKGGTTEAGLRVLEEGDFAELVRDCVARATQRSRELSGE